MEIPGLNTLQSCEVESLIPKADWERLQGFKWLAFGKPEFKVLFVNLESGIWEGHWFGTEARESYKLALLALQKLKEENPGCEIRGVTPCENTKALKMAKLLGFQPLGFKKDFNDRVCLCTVWKEN